MKAHWQDPVYRANVARGRSLARNCIHNAHVWRALCKCGAAAVCSKCGMGKGEIPCACKQAARDE